MALVKNEELVTGISLTEGYYRVTAVDLKADKRAEITVSVYKDANVRKAGKLMIEDRVYVVSKTEFDTFFDVMVLDQVGNNPYKVAYEYLKTLPEFSTALNM